MRARQDGCRDELVRVEAIQVRRQAADFRQALNAWDASAGVRPVVAADAEHQLHPPRAVGAEKSVDPESVVPVPGGRWREQWIVLSAHLDAAAELCTQAAVRFAARSFAGLAAVAQPEERPDAAAPAWKRARKL